MCQDSWGTVLDGNLHEHIACYVAMAMVAKDQVCENMVVDDTLVVESCVAVAANGVLLAESLQAQCQTRVRPMQSS